MKPADLRLVVCQTRVSKSSVSEHEINIGQKCACFVSDFTAGRKITAHAEERESRKTILKPAAKHLGISVTSL